MIVTREEVLEVLASLDAPVDVEDARTASEWSDTFSWGLKKTRKALKTLKQQGLAEVVTVYRERLDGIPSPRPGYRLLLDRSETTT